LTKPRRRVWQLLEEHDSADRVGRAVDLALIVLIVVNVIAVILETVRPIYALAPRLFLWIEVISVAVFTVEYIARLWAAPESRRFAHPVGGRIRFAFTPMAVIDLLAVLPFYLPLVGIDLRFLRALRLMRIFRLAKLGRYLGVMSLFSAVARNKREELIMTTFVLVLLLVMTSSLMYFVEGAAQPEAFTSIPATMWWAVATLTTVGYGDIYPITAAGRMLGAVVAVLGIGLFALPTAILGSGFVEELERRRAGRAAEGEAPVASTPRFCPHCGERLPEG
jgi:voltage-gated potassium channel